MKLKVTVNGTEYDVDVEIEEEPLPTLGSITVGGTGGAAPVAAPRPAGSGNGLAAPISGTVLKILVEPGAEVKAGDVLVVLEAMKMETEIQAAGDATVASIPVAVGEAVSGGQTLVEFA